MLLPPNTSLKLSASHALDEPWRFGGVTCPSRVVSSSSVPPNPLAPRIQRSCMERDIVTEPVRSFNHLP